MDIISQAQSDSSLLNCDVAIVGGGMVGMTLALALAENPALKIIVLEANPEPAVFAVESYHHRVSALALSSVRMLNSLRVWPQIQARRVSPFKSIEVFDTENKSDLHFASNEIGEARLGYIVENNVIQQSLREKLDTCANINILTPVKLKSYTETAAHCLLETEEHGVIKTKLAVAADGAKSWLRQAAKIDTQTHAYAQSAIVAAIKTELPHQQCARQVFSSNGILAFLPLQDAHLSSIVWSLPHAEAERLQNLSEDKFKVELAAAFGKRLGEIQNIDKRFVFPLQKQEAVCYVRNRVVLVGDAAHVMHPLAGQGVNLGLLDAAALAQIILTAVSEKRDIADNLVLRRYERWRKGDNLALLTGIDIIKQLFASDKVIVQSARSMGLAATKRFALLKNIFTRYAVGMRDGLPELAKNG